MQKLKTLLTLVGVGLSLGATIREKLSLTFFILSARLRAPRAPVTKAFRITAYGATLTVRLRNNFADAYLLSEAFRSNDYLLALPSEPETIFDLGANLGFVALAFAVRYPHARIYCFEPDPENFAELRANTAAFPQITCFPLAVGAKNETRSFYKSSVFHMRNSLIARSGNDDRIEVQVISLEEAIVRTGVARIDLMKFDVEGAEAEIFSAFTRFERIAAIIGEIHPYLWKGNEESELLATLRAQYAVTLRTEGGKTFLTGTTLS